MIKKSDLSAIRERADKATAVDPDYRSALLYGIASVDIPALLDEIECLREALEKIKALGTQTLLGDPADYDFDAEEAYSGGAHNAFCEAADIARQALGEEDG